MMSSKPLQILLVDDDPSMQRLLRKWLENAGYWVTTANDGSDAQQHILESCPQLLITDWDMPNIDGLGLCTWLRQQKTQNYIYTIFLTSRSASQDMIMALETGADDFIKKPVDKGELLARVRSAARMLELERQLSILARTDPLTGLMTRRTFFEIVEREFARAGRHRCPLSCVMIDIDYFKRINDTHGHLVGDHALRTLAKILQQNCRVTDAIGRYGGEEFCVLLPETTEEQALQWAERVRQTIAGTQWTVQEVELNMTASFGVAQRMAETRSAEEFVDQADQALLIAKRTGRDRVVGFQSVHSNGQFQPGQAAPASIFQNKTASEVMATNVVGLRDDDTVGRAVQYFLKYQFNSAPVVNQEGKLVGIVSERDVMSTMFMPNWSRSLIKDVMRCNVICYEEDTPILLIYEFLCRVSIHGVFIVRDGHPVGIISRTSLLGWFTNLLGLDPHGKLDGPIPQTDERTVSAEPRRSLATIAHAIMVEAEAMGQVLGRPPMDVDLSDVSVSGSASRIEALINNLLAYSREIGAVTDEFQISPTARADVALGLTGLLTSGS